MFVYFTLRTLTNLIMCQHALPEILLMFETKRIKDVMKLFHSKEMLARAQALQLVSEIGVSDENQLKEKLLATNVVPAIVKVQITYVQY